MAFDRYRLRYAALTVLFALTVLGAAYAAFERGYLFTAVVLGAAAFGEACALLRLVERHVRDMARFVESVRWDDLGGSFTAEDGGGATAELGAALDTALSRLREAHERLEGDSIFLREVVEHAGIGMIAYRSDGAVVFANRTAKRLLGMPKLETVGDIARLHPNLGRALDRTEPGGRTMVAVGEGIETVELALHTAEAAVHSGQVTIASFHDIRGELEEREAEAWQNLIRVLTHEIMNSVTPIASLASTARNLLEDRDGSGGITDGEAVEDVRGAVRTIEERSRGLLRFVESYRKLTRIPQPRFRMVRAGELIDRVRRLMNERLDTAGIRCEVNIEPPSLEIAADPELLEQALINLVQNAIQALEGYNEGVVRLAAGLDELARPFLTVADNGPGMEPEVMEKIFIPFFTTRHDGTGIGLSLARRIVRLHGGSMSVRSKPGMETAFTMRLPG